ncbi:hypothetical protein D3C87_1035380 [compost metagenome]
MAGHPQLKIVVAGEVEAPVPEPQRPAGGEPVILFRANQRACRKQGGPARRIRQIPQQIPALIRIQPEGAQGSGSEHVKRQADMAAPKLEAGERGPQHQLGAAAQIGHQFGKLQIQLADTPRQRQGFQPFDHTVALHLAPHASALFGFSKR